MSGVNGVSVEIQGVAELSKALATLPRELQETILKGAVGEASEVITNAVRQEAPVRGPGQPKNHPRGYLKAAIDQGKPRRSKDKGWTSSTRFDTKQFPALISMSKGGDRYFYPAAVEFGTAHAPPVGFMRRAYDGVREIALGRLLRTIQEQIEHWLASQVKR